MQQAACETVRLFSEKQLPRGGSRIRLRTDAELQKKKNMIH